MPAVFACVAFHSVRACAIRSQPSGLRQTRRRRCTNISGFTLVELLVAITVLAIVAVLGWRGLDTLVRSRVALTSEMGQTRGMQLTFAQLQSDCAHVASVAILPNRAPVVVDHDRLTLVRTVFDDGQPTRMQVVAYRLKDGVLSRRESATTRNLNELDALWLAATGDVENSQSVTLMSDVAAMTMRTWTSGGSDWRSGSEPGTSAPLGPTATPSVLTGLEVSLRLYRHEQASNITKIFLLGAV